MIINVIVLKDKRKKFKFNPKKKYQIIIYYLFLIN